MGFLLQIPDSKVWEMNINRYCDNVSNNFKKLREISSIIADATDQVAKALRCGNKILFCGNGGSAADSQHLAAELMGLFLIDRSPLPAIALTTDTSALTAIGNDYSFENVFSRQVCGLGQSGDVLIGLSTSGNSRNVVKAFKTAKELGLSTIGLTGSSGGQMKVLCDLCICVPSDQTNHIQEMHIAIGHMICGVVEEQLCSSKS